MKQFLMSFVIVIVGCIWVISCADAEPIELTAGMYIGAEPLYMSEERHGKTEFFGMNVEIINAFVQRDSDFQFTYMGNLPASRLFEYLKEDRVQVVFGIARNAEREAWYQYTDTPLYPVKFGILARADDTEIRDIHTYKEMKQAGGTVLGLRGSSAIKVFEEQTKDLNIPIEVTTTIEQNFKKLLAHRGRFFVFNHYTLIEGAKQLGYQDQVVMLPLVVRETSHWMAFSKAVPQDIVQRANAVLRELKESGELQRIYDRYGNLP